jgi:hypothetical protein
LSDGSPNTSLAVLSDNMAVIFESTSTGMIEVTETPTSAPENTGNAEENELGTGGSQIMLTESTETASTTEYTMTWNQFFHDYRATLLTMLVAIIGLGIILALKELVMLLKPKKL